MPSIRSRIFQVEHKSLSTISEDNLLATIKTASVNKRWKTSHRNIVQSPGESFQSYFARIKAKATLCDFTVKAKCSNNCTKNLDILISYMDKAIKSQLITGSDNPDHSQRLVVEVDKYTNTAEKLALLDNLYTHRREQE